VINATWNGSSVKILRYVDPEEYSHSIKNDSPLDTTVVLFEPGQLTAEAVALAELVNDPETVLEPDAVVDAVPVAEDVEVEEPDISFAPQTPLLLTAAPNTFFK